MSLVINHNMMAMNATRHLNAAYNRLAKSTERLSSGLRVNSAADDAAGLAIRELMRADIDVINQGIRNAADAISMIQTAEGALSVIDEKLTRMKELAEQASTGTYTTAQREIINSEYQAMAAEINRIASATNFNGVKILDGSLKSLHDGSGIKIHFGTGNNRAEDYYFINMGDMRASSSTGLRVGNSDPRDIWRTTALNASNPAQPLAETAREGGRTPGVFGLQFSKGIDPDGNPTSCGGPGVWQMYGYVTVDPACENITDLVQKINQGSQAHGSFNISSAATLGALDGQEMIINGQVYKFDVNAAFSTAMYNGTQSVTTIGLQGLASTATTTAMKSLAVMLNSHYSQTGVLAAMNGSTMEMYAMEFGVKGNDTAISSGTTLITRSHETLRGGGETAMTAELCWDEDKQEYELQISMNKGGDRYQMRIFTLTSQATAGHVIGDPMSSVGYLGYLPTDVTNNTDHINNYGSTNDEHEWKEAQNGSGRTNWDGADILTQSAAQRALASLDAAIVGKDQRRAELGSYANRLENTITNLQIQLENLQSAESRISDVDVGSEMTEYSRNQILANVATSMLAQANSLPQLALKLLGQ